MNAACLLLSAWLSAVACPPEPPPILRGFSNATYMRPDIERAATVANRLLSAAGEPSRIVPAWALTGRGPKNTRSWSTS